MYLPLNGSIHLMHYPSITASRCISCRIQTAINPHEIDTSKTNRQKVAHDGIKRSLRSTPPTHHTVLLDTLTISHKQVVVAKKSCKKVWSMSLYWSFYRCTFRLVGVYLPQLSSWLWFWITATQMDSRRHKVLEGPLRFCYFRFTFNNYHHWFI